MRQIWLSLAFSFACFVSSLAAQDIVITAPTKPIPQDRSRLLPVSGINEAEFNAATLDVVPADGVQVFRISHTLLIVVVDEDAAPGIRTLTLALNPWRQSLDKSLAQAQWAKIDAALLAEYETLAKKLAAKYPFRSGSCVLEVAGTVPFPQPKPDPNPQPQPQPPSKVTRLTFVYEKDLHPVPRPVLAALSKINADSSGSVVASVFEEDTLDGTGQTPDQYAIALDAARKAGLPALVVQAGDVVLRVVKNPTTEAHVLEAAK